MCVIVRVLVCVCVCVCVVCVWQHRVCACVRVCDCFPDLRVWLQMRSFVVALLLLVTVSVISARSIDDGNNGRELRELEGACNFSLRFQLLLVLSYLARSSSF